MAYNGKTVSLGRILWEVTNNPLAKDLDYAEAAGYALSFLRLLGAPTILTTKITKPSDTPIVEYRCKVPADLYRVNGMKYVSNEEDGNELYKGMSLNKSTDIYHNGNLPEGMSTEFQDFTYTVDNNYIKTSMEDGFLILSYTAFNVDEYGFPMIPDDERTIEGARYYILYRYLENLWMAGIINDKTFRYIEQKKLFYLPSASSSLRLPDADTLESAMNGINRLISMPNAHRDGFRYYGSKEYTKQWR